MFPIQSRILFRNARESPLGRIGVAGFGHNSLGPIPMRVLGEYAIVYSLSGRARYRDAGKIDQKILPGDLIILFPEIGHRYGPGPGENWDEFYITFEGPVFDLWRKQGLLNPRRPILHLEPIDYWLRKFERCVAENSGSRPEEVVAEICRLQEVLAEALVAQQQSAMGKHEEEWLTKARHLLEAKGSAEMDLEEISKKLGTSYENFRKKFVKWSGVSPGKYQMARRMDRACELIHEGRQTNKEIARTLGFCDEFHFSKRFKQITGSSPRNFRNRLSRSGK